MQLSENVLFLNIWVKKQHNLIYFWKNIEYLKQYMCMLS